MYHALLTNRYLTSRVIPLIAVAAVALCVALVIVVVSVMTGFLDMVRDSGRKLMGDVVISCPVNGVPYYERLVERLNRLPSAVAASPLVESWGLLKMPYPQGQQKQTETVQIWGIEPLSFAKVTGFADSLDWKELEQPQWERLFEDVLAKHWKPLLDSLSNEQRVGLMMNVLLLDPGRGAPNEAMVREHVAQMSEDEWRQLFRGLRFEPETLKASVSTVQWDALLAHEPRLRSPNQILQDGLTLSRDGRPGIALGKHVSEGNKRDEHGKYEIVAEGYWWMPAFDVTLTTLPLQAGDLGSEPESRILPVVNEFMSGVYLIDDKRVMIPLGVAQQLLHLDGGEIVDEDDPTKVIGIDPPRATMILIRARDGVTPEQLRDQVENEYLEFRREVAADPQATVFPASVGMGLSVKTWAQQQTEFIGPVEKERELMRTLFSIVYVVCGALVLSIFWAIVHEKTRDIGILRSIGASRGGIIWIFLRYGLIVGVIGSIVGLGLATLVVRNINAIHSALGDPPLGLGVGVLAVAVLVILVTVIKSVQGRLLPLVLGTLVSLALVGVGIGALVLRHLGGVVVWDPSVYYFSVIPSSMDFTTAITTMIGAVVFSLLGAAVPAAKAADTDPVQALRYE